MDEYQYLIPIYIQSKDLKNKLKKQKAVQEKKELNEKSCHSNLK